MNPPFCEKVHIKLHFEILLPGLEFRRPINFYRGRQTLSFSAEKEENREMSQYSKVYLHFNKYVA